MKSLLQLIIITVILQGVVLSVHAQQKTPDSTRTMAWENFRAQEGDNWKIRWDTTTGLPRTIMGDKSKVFNGPPVTAAKTFLKKHRSLFGVKSDLSDLQLEKIQTNRGIHHVSFRQYYRGLPVKGAQYKIHLSSEGKIDMANGFYYPGIDIEISAGISESAAIDIAASDAGLSGPAGKRSTSSLVVYPMQGQYKLTWQVHLSNEESYLNYHYFVDAQTGKILEKYSLITSVTNNSLLTKLNVDEVHKEKTPGNFVGIVTGTGDVYPAHPGISSIGTKNLYGLNGNGKLDGTYVRAKNNEYPEAFSAIHTFQYAPSDPHFDEVSLYYHVDNFRRNYIENLDSGDNLFPFIEAYAHHNDICQGGAFGACFDRVTDDIYFGDGFDFAKEDKVIYHEYSHRVVGDIENEIRFGDNEEGAISEGLPDYFAGSFTGRSKILDYALPTSQRDMANPFYSDYGEYLDDQNDGTPVPGHDGGEFFSSILWDLRNNLFVGPTITDFLVFDAIFRVSGNPDFVEFRDAMIASDQAFYGGNHQTAIWNVFANKGLGFPIDTSFKVEIAGTAIANPGDLATYTANVSNGIAPYTFSWFRDNLDGSGFQFVGNGSSYAQIVNDDIHVKVIATDGNQETDNDIQITNVFGGGGGPDPEASPVTAGPVEPDIPESFTLQQNFPNPFNPTTQISYGLPEAAQVSITVYDITGRQVAVLANGSQSAGRHTVSFQAENLSSGMYIARIEAVGSSGQVFTRNIKMQLIK